MRYLLIPALLLISLTTSGQNSRDEIENQLTRSKPWVLADKRSSLGGNRSSVFSTSMELQFRQGGFGSCQESMSDKIVFSTTFRWTLSLDTNNETVLKITSDGKGQRTSTNPDNFMFGPDAIRTGSNEFNVRAVSLFMKKTPTPTRNDNVQLRFTPVRTEKATVHYFFN